MDEKVIQLSGYDLTFEAIDKIAKEGYTVRISEDAVKRLVKSSEFLKCLSDRGDAVYGLNTGVGWNKDKKVFSEYYDQFNKNLIRSHMIGIDPICTEEECRAILVIRLNGFLNGHTGVDPIIASYYETFLNLNIHPVIKKRGSIGEADIGILSAVGLALIGEGEVIYGGKVMPAKEAFVKAGVKSLTLGPKDGLSIVSSNAQSAAMAAMAVIEAEEFIAVYHLIYCLSLEGLNGVVAPLETEVNAVRGYSGQITCANYCKKNLEGSYLYEPDSNRALQDPLSFRCHSAVMGGVTDALNYLKKQLLIEINSTDDNPCLLPELNKCLGSANFEPLSWVLAVEMVTIGFTHVSKMIANQTLHLANPNFTKLSRFLSPDEGQVIAYGTIQKTIGALDGENRMYANPSSMDFLNLAGNIEDHGTNASLAADKLRKLIDNLYYMAAIELMHGAQAVDYRLPIALGTETKKLYEAYRLFVPHLDADRNLSVDIQTTMEFLKRYKGVNDCKVDEMKS
jgi:histidine ammonia-lyase